MGRQRVKGMALGAEAADGLAASVARGLAERLEIQDEETWILNEQGVRSVFSANSVHSARRVFEVRTVPLADMTSYELSRVLHDKGCSWKEWLPPSRCTAASGKMPLGYDRTSPKVWYSKRGQVSQLYLRCLCGAEIHLLFRMAMPDVVVLF